MATWTSVSIPKDLKEYMEQKRYELAGGQPNEKLREVLCPAKCPLCGGELVVIERVRTEVEIVRCKKCGHTQPRMRLEVAGSTTNTAALLGVLAGLGLGLLLGFAFTALLLLTR
jgi:Zn ribbon nucleic-acid-binding protein